MPDISPSEIDQLFNPDFYADVKTVLENVMKLMETYYSNLPNAPVAGGKLGMLIELLRLPPDVRPTMQQLDQWYRKYYRCFSDVSQDAI